jgi:hypothetical protein
LEYNANRAAERGVVGKDENAYNAARAATGLFERGYKGNGRIAKVSSEEGLRAHRVVTNPSGSLLSGGKKISEDDLPADIRAQFAQFESQQKQPSTPPPSSNNAVQQPKITQDLISKLSSLNNSLNKNNSSNQSASNQSASY